MMKFILPIALMLLANAALGAEALKRAKADGAIVNPTAIYLESSIGSAKFSPRRLQASGGTGGFTLLTGRQQSQDLVVSLAEEQLQFLCSDRGGKLKNLLTFDGADNGWPCKKVKCRQLDGTKFLPFDAVVDGKSATVRSIQNVCFPALLNGGAQPIAGYVTSKIRLHEPADSNVIEAIDVPGYTGNVSLKTERFGLHEVAIAFAKAPLTSCSNILPDLHDFTVSAEAVLSSDLTDCSSTNEEISLTGVARLKSGSVTQVLAGTEMDTPVCLVQTEIVALSLSGDGNSLSLDTSNGSSDPNDAGDPICLSSGCSAGSFTAVLSNSVAVLTPALFGNWSIGGNTYLQTSSDGLYLYGVGTGVYEGPYDLQIENGACIPLAGSPQRAVKGLRIRFN